jgi:hypothetical protein
MMAAVATHFQMKGSQARPALLFGSSLCLGLYFVGCRCGCNLTMTSSSTFRSIFSVRKDFFMMLGWTFVCFVHCKQQQASFYHCLSNTCMGTPTLFCVNTSKCWILNISVQLISTRLSSNTFFQIFECKTKVQSWFELKL